MARKFDGVDDKLEGSGISLLSGADAFTILVRYKAATVDQGSDTPVLAQNGTTGGFWRVRHVGANVAFSAQGFASAYTVAVDDTDWHTYIFRHRAGGQIARFVDASFASYGTTTETIAALTNSTFYVGHGFSGSAFLDGSIGDIAVWNVALADAICYELGHGASPRHFPVGRQAHWEINGNRSPEIDWTTGKTLTVTGTTTVDHPPRVPWRHRTKVEPCWIVDVEHSSTVRASTRDLYDERDYDVLGAVYPARIIADMTLIEALPDGGGVIDYGQAVLQVTTADGGFDADEDYQGDLVSIKKYDRVSGALTECFTGFVDHQQQTGPQALRLALRSDDPQLRTPIPRLAVEFRDEDSSDGLTNTTDSGLTPRSQSAPYPIACGDGGMCSPPSLRYVDDDPGGEELVVAWDDNTVVKGAWADKEAGQPGLEKLALWTDDIAGTPTYASTSTFTVTMSESEFGSWFRVGYEVRQTTDGTATNPTWREAKITGVAWSTGTGTVTVSPAVLSSPLDNGTTRLFEISTELILSTTDWEYVGSVTTPLTTALVPTTTGNPIGRPLVQLSTTDRANPADLIKFIVEDDDQGMGQTLNAEDYSDVYNAFNNIAALATCVKTVLGGDGTTRPARDWLNDIALLRGCRMWRDSAGEWRLRIDRQPPASNLLTLGYGVNTTINQENNLLAPPVYDRIPRSQQTSVLKLLYSSGGRSRGDKAFVQEDYAFRTQMSVHEGGFERRLPTLLLRDHDAAATVTWYVGKRLQHGVERAGYVVDHDAWRVQVGELITDAAKDVNYRVIRKQQTLTTYTLGCEGYDSEIFTTNLTTIRGEVDQPTAYGNPDEREIHSSLGGNLIVNPDFSTGLARDPTTVGDLIDYTLLPEWQILNGTKVAPIAVVSDSRATGGRYLEFTTAGSNASIATFMAAPRPSLDYIAGAIPVNDNLPLIFSVYVNTTATAGAWTGIQAEFDWFNDGTDIEDDYIGTTTPDLKVLPGDRNGLTWRRIWCSTRRPNDTCKQVVLKLRPLLNSTTYQLDALQLERQASLFLRPSNWQPHGRTGLQPQQIAPADQFSIRPTGAITAGLTFSPMTDDDYSTGGVTLSGTSTTLLTWPGGYWTDCAGRITGTVSLSAGTTWDIREGSTTGRKLMSAISTTGTFDIAKTAIANPVYIPASTAIVAVPTTNPGTATFSGGAKVKLAAVPFKTEVPEV